jgi:plasmid stabilization system protein ParE
VIYSFHPEAESEFTGAIDYYEDKEKGLGYDFTLEVYSTIQRILAHPDAWAVIEENIRRSFVRRFPFGILYSHTEEEVIIVAVMHLNREPDYWKERI